MTWSHDIACFETKANLFDGRPPLIIFNFAELTGAFDILN